MDVSKGQILLTFDDGLSIHEETAELLSGHSLRGTFGVLPSLVGRPGVMDGDSLDILKKTGHFVCNHSWSHPWSGVGEAKPGLTPAGSENALTEDYLKGRDELNKMGFHGDYLILPFGTHNVAGDPHLRKLTEEFAWIRMTIGSPLPDEMGLWQPEGYKRHYPFGYSAKVIGITEAADMRRPDGVAIAADTAAEAGVLAVITYHDVADPVGGCQNVTWARFLSDVKHIASRCESGTLECVTPDVLVEGRSSD